jgi:hypothetical protein
VLTSSLIDLQDSIFMATITSFVNNTAGAVISTTGSAQHSLQLLQDTQLQDNTATWLIVADSFAADLVGRENLLAPHPTEQNTKKKLKYEPAYTTHDFIWHLKDMSDWQQELPRQVTAPKASRYVGTAPLGQVRGTACWTGRLRKKTRTKVLQGGDTQPCCLRQGSAEGGPAHC